MKKTNTFVYLFGSFMVIMFFPLIFSNGKISGNYGDIYLHYYPLKHLVAEHIIKGDVPLWNPYIYAGQPLLANPQSAVFYPGTLMYLFFPLSYAFNYFFIIHFFLCGLFFYLMLSSFKLSRTSSLLGSISFAFSSFMIFKVPAGHPVALSGYIWLPLIILFLRKMLFDPVLAWIIIFALTVSVQFLTGHTFPVYISFIMILFYALKKNSQNTLMLLLIACVMTVFLSAIQLIPSIELSKMSEIGNWPDLVKNYSLPLKNFINILFPGFYGDIISGTFVFQQNPSYFFERHSIYFGFFPFILSLFGLFFALRQKKFFYPLVAAAGILLSLGFQTPLYNLLYDYVPGFSFLRVPARFYFITLIALIILASQGWNKFIVPLKVNLKILLILFVFFDLLFWGHRFIFTEPIDLYEKKSEISSFIDPLYRIITEPDRIPSNKSMLYHHYNLNGYEAIILKNFTRYIGLQEKKSIGSTGLARTDLMSPLVKGFASKYVIGFKSIKNSLLVKEFSNGLKIFSIPDALPRLFLTRSTKYFNSNNIDEAISEIEYLQKTSLSPKHEVTVNSLIDEDIYDNRYAELFSYSVDQELISAELSLSATGFLVFSEIEYPGWQAIAKTSKFKVFPSNKSLRGVLLPPGKYLKKDRVYMYYLPPSWRFGLYITIIGIMIILFIAFKTAYLMAYYKRREI